MAKHSDDDLRRIAAHVVYERNMLVASVAQAGHVQGETSMALDDRAFWLNVLTESALLHVRLLDDFLRLKERSRNDDVIALDYLPDPQRWTPTAILSDEDRVDVNKKLAHLTLHRRPQRSWPLSDYRDRAMELLHGFGAALPPERLAWFIEPDTAEVV